MIGDLDPYERAIWEAAYRFLYMRSEQVKWDDPDVIALRDLLLEAYEMGAKRSTGQMAQIDQALGAYHRLSPGMSFTIKRGTPDAD